MRYLPGMPDVEGAICNPAYDRAGCRTPMQWDDGPNAGFSRAPASSLYLPVDDAPDRPTVAAQLDDPGSTLHLVRRLIRLRREVPVLGGRASTEVVHGGYPFAYVRGGTHLVVVNPREEPASLVTDVAGSAEILLGVGCTTSSSDAGLELRLDGFGYAVLALQTQ
jgi:maltose alpha-D-glucosyltransferase/alpha-amylase